ncbi:unsaturated rhamnogalacturonyl hydrolase YteR [Saccharicrinis fermentans DSM 9555 = JCM 21142]|uniref:Unsaturated rhamnogalacturonyl hydrolase YteR n=2 Tax=Saccharicrinis fermentans TaxID=982 RepID=W7Y2R7_9BACT|nr:unsaturated rhamnogalacturonyl hydrolase YteR [Saccharicrinis fermentans DSM 9555 = JCM 21142]
MKKLIPLLLMMVWVSCTQKQPIPNASDVFEITQRVADWQLNTWDEQGKYRALPPDENRKKWHHRKPYHDLEWLPATFYTGLFQFSEIAGDNKYEDWLIEMGNKHQWKLHKRMYHADDQAVGQFYLNMYRLTAKEYMLQPTMKQFNAMMESERRDEWHWHWCDALFMAPPVWARLSKVTSLKKYLDYMDQQYHMTYDILWDEEVQLFFRDKSFLDKKEKNGHKVFWSRGNGWVYGGLALMIPDLPASWDGRHFYIDLFKKMSETIKKTQRNDGTWSSGLLGDENDYPNIETSGTSFFVFGLAWGIENGILDKDVYEPVLLSAWSALKNAVTDQGMVGYVQPVGAAPGCSYPEYTELYGSGAFLAAGTEMYKYVRKFYPLPNDEKKKSQFTTFMYNGGWCWYQGPRAVINDGKLVIGGVDGQQGDVNVGVYDLDVDSIWGKVTLHEKMQADDHDVPALYVRPDGRILAVWAKHGNEKVHYYNISAPNNYMNWGERMEYKHVYDDKRGVTYMNLYYLKNEERLYNLYRDGETFNPAFIVSNDHGQTWSNRTHFIANDVKGRQRPYCCYVQLDENTIGIAYTDAHPRMYGNSVYYAQYKEGAFYRVDGTKIKDLKEGPLYTSEGEKIYTGSESKEKPIGYESVPNSGWTCAMGQDENGYPYIGYSLYLSNSDHRYRMASWDGKQWNDREIAYAGKCLYYVESSYTGLMTFDPTNPKKVYISTDVNPSTGEDLGGRHEIYEATIGSKDDVSTIKWKAITSDSNYRNIRPIVVANQGYKVLLWLHGAWNTYVNYDVCVKGMILERPE